jgi:hypothetical protein
MELSAQPRPPVSMNHGRPTPEGLRSVLMVLYFYPPLGGISMSRNARNVQYLPRFGWQPTVLTPRRPGYELRDPSALSLIPDDVDVIRSGSIEAGHVRPAVVQVASAIRGRFGTVHATGSGIDRSTSASSGPATEAAPSPIERMRRLLFFPDDQVGWLPFAVVAALRAHRASPFDAIYSTSSPITAHLVAGVVKRLTGLPWVAEFRDPWVGNALAAPLPWMHRRLQVKIERWIAGTADRIVGVSPGITRLYRTRYPGAPDMVTITSGYDRGESRARPAAPPRGDGRFRLVYTGTLDRPVELAAFLEGLDRLMTDRPELIDRFELDVYGNVSDSCGIVVQRYADRAWAGILRFHGFVPRGVALDAVAQADAALILLGSGPGMELFIGGKLFDYLGQDQQILGMLPRGDSRAILESLDWGVACDPEPGDVARALGILLSTPRPDRPADPTGRYDRVALAGELARSLDAVTARARRST